MTTPAVSPLPLAVERAIRVKLVEAYARGLRDGRAARFAERTSDRGPPGPPPRPGLKWKEETQRWVREDGSDEPEQGGDSGQINPRSGGGGTAATLGDGRTIQFTPRPTQSPFQTMVMVDPKKLYDSLPEDDRIPLGGGGPMEIPEQRARLKKHIADGKPLWSIELDPTRTGYRVNDGRHRLTELIALGADKIGVTVPKHAAEHVVSKYGFPAPKPTEPDPTTPPTEQPKAGKRSLLGRLFSKAVGHSEYTPPHIVTFAELPAAHDELALAGRDGRRATELMSAAKATGRDVLARLTEQAVERLLKEPNPLASSVLFSDDELKEVADSLSATNATADLLGRARVRRMAEKANRAATSDRVHRFAEGPAGKKYSYVGINIYGPAADAIKGLAAKIDPADLGEDGIETSPHVTVRYGLHTTNPDDVAKLLAGAGPIRYTLRGLSAFLGEETGKPYDVLYIPVESDDLIRLNAKLGELPHTDTHPEYHPHATIAYLKAGKAREFVRQYGTYTRTDGPPVRGEGETNVVEFSDPEKNKASISLSAEPSVIRFSEGADDPFDVFDESPPALSPNRAADYFQKLVPSIGVDPLRYGPLFDRHAFTLAHAADQVLLDKVKSIIQEQLSAGTRPEAVADIQEALDAAGVTVKNPQYPDMVYRTNMNDSFMQGFSAEMADPVMRETFPVWQYLGIRDGRQGKDHEVKFDKYFPATATFAEVRGNRPFNCRCSAAPVTKYELEDLQKRGVKVEERW